MSKILLIVSIFFVALTYSFVIQPFEVPDENAHFSSLTFLHNEGRMPTLLDKDNLSIEELEAEKIFGVVEGQNKYSYHPEYRVEYVPGTIGKYESTIALLNTLGNRTKYESYQAATYPPLYYTLLLPFYNMANSRDILTRIFVSRL